MPELNIHEFPAETITFDYEVLFKGKTYDVITQHLSQTLLEPICEGSKLRVIDLMDVSAIRSNFVEAVKSYILFKYYEFIEGKHHKVKKVPEKYTKALSYYMNCDKNRREWMLLCWEIQLKTDNLGEHLQGV